MLDPRYIPPMSVAIGKLQDFSMHNSHNLKKKNHIKKILKMKLKYYIYETQKLQTVRK